MSKAEGLRQGILKREGVLRKIGGCIFKYSNTMMI